MDARKGALLNTRFKPFSLKVLKRLITLYARRATKCHEVRSGTQIHVFMPRDPPIGRDSCT